MATVTKLSRGQKLEALQKNYFDQLVKNEGISPNQAQTLTTTETARIEEIFNANNEDLELAKPRVEELAHDDAELQKKNEMNMDKTVAQIEVRNEQEIQQKGPEMDL